MKVKTIHAFGSLSNTVFFSLIVETSGSLAHRAVD
jgi:hypothetical protein